MSRSPDFQVWKRLDPTTRQIRILIIKPCNSINDTLSGQLIEESLDGNPHYDAISHAWGRAQSVGFIYIGGNRVPITASLHACLRHLRHASEERVYWVDALCINQYDKEERSQQVQQMEHIFRMAKTVRVWLGDMKSEHIGREFQIIKLIASGHKFEDIRIEGEALGPVDARMLSRVTKSSWFGRLWVRQEAALARDLVFHHEQNQISFADVKDFYNAALGWWEDLGSNSITGGLGLMSAASSKLTAIVELRDFLLDTSRSAHETSRVLVHCLADARKLQVSDCKDRIYGMVGIFTARLDKDVVLVDYNKNPQEIFTSFATKFIYTSGTLSLLNQANHVFNKLTDRLTFLGSRLVVRL